jgi:hypothetical protein
MDEASYDSFNGNENDNDNDNDNGNAASSNSSHTTRKNGGCGFFSASILFLAGAAIIITVCAMNSGNDSFVGNKLRSGIHSVAEDIAKKTTPHYKLNGSGPYSLIEAHKGKSFFDYYIFNDGPDSIGSAGYNTYVGRKVAEALGLIKVEADDNTDENDNDNNDNEYVYLSSKAGTNYDEYGNRFRDSIRLEGKRRFDHGLIILDVSKMPTGCGVWPAFWSTDETDWPKNGEIDIVEPINNQVVAKTALHTSEDCSMYAQVPRWNWTGHWDSATGLPNKFTGVTDFDSALEADNCWAEAPHQWFNQGCVAINNNNNTIGAPMNEGKRLESEDDTDESGSETATASPNENGSGKTETETGGIYVLEWDPTGGYIRSWVFPRSEEIPSNLQEALNSTNTNANDNSNNNSIVRPDPFTWPTPYAYFAIGEGSGCSADHFANHRLVINLAFCGAVAGNRFQKDCPALYDKYNVHNDSVATCNAYIDSEEAQAALELEAFWKIKGVYLYQRDE